MKKHIIIPLTLLALSLSASAAKPGESDKDEYAKGVKTHQSIFYSGMKKGVAGYRIPAIITAKNGALVTAIDERVPNISDLMHSKDINIAVRVSKNGGRRWSKAKVIVDFPYGQSASDPSLILDEKTGYIYCFYNFMDLVKEKDVYYFHYVVSKNNGMSWSKPVDITKQISKPERQGHFQFIPSGRGIYSSDDKMLHTLLDLKSGLRIFGSDDHGKSWYVIETPIKPANESKIIELSDGRWMVNSRVGKGHRHIHISDDKGKSWSSYSDSQLPDPSCNGSIVRYSAKRDGADKDRLIFSNCNSSKGRVNLALRISYDEGKTWSKGKTLYAGSSAYSDLSVLENGDIAVFFEKDGHKNNDVAIVSLKWLTDGEDTYKPRDNKKSKAKKKR